MATEGPLELVANGSGGGKLDKLLPFKAQGVYVQNFTAGFVRVDGAGFYPPNSSGSSPLIGTNKASARFEGPPGAIQPTAPAGQTCFITYVDREVPWSAGPVQGSQLAAVIQIERSIRAALPAAGNPGRLELLTDYDRGIWKDTGTQFVSIEGEVFNVKQFGALGNAIADDTVAIQLALTAAAVSGGEVLFPPGTYVVTSSLTVASNVHVRGEGSVSLISMSGAWAGSQGLFVVTNASRVIIEDLQIDGVRTGKSNVSTARAVYVSTSTSIRVRRLVIQDCSHAGILFDIGCTDVVASENRIFRGGDGGANGALANGISTDGTAASPTTGVVIAHNYIEAATDTGIGIHDVSTFVAVVGNTINGTGVGRGIDLPECSQIACVGNAIRGTAGNGGIYVGANNPDARDSVDMSITGNTIIQDAAGAAGAHGIIVSGTAARTRRRITISGNTIVGWKGLGISGLLNVSESSITGNVIQGSGSHGISLDQGANVIDRCIVSGNLIKDSGGYALNVHPGLANNKVRGNLLYNNALGSTNMTNAQKITNEWGDNGPQDIETELTAHVLAQAGAAPGLAAGAQAGAGPPAPVLVNGTDAKARLTFGTGAGPVAGNMVQVTFAVAYSVVPTIVVSAENAAAGALILYPANVTVNGFSINVVNAPAAAQGNGTYAATFHVLQ